MPVNNKCVDVIILVSQAYKIKPHADDILLRAELSRYGLVVEIMAWDDSDFDFYTCKAAIIRSCWDYDQRVEEFFLKIKDIAKSCILINSLGTITRYKNKYYLASIKGHGIPIVPTEFATNLDEVFAAVQKLESEKIVIKPVVSASGRDTHLIDVSDNLTIGIASKSILGDNKDIVVQQYIDTIEKVGEKSTVVIDGVIVHTVLKTPRQGDFLIHEHHGGLYTNSIALEADQQFIEEILKTFETTPVYLRVDYLFDQSSGPMLLELELIEPNLYLSRSRATLEKLAEKVTEIVR